MPKKILILGGARFHGLQLAEYFAKKGEEVFVLNRGKYRAEYNFGINHLIADRNNPTQLKETLENHLFDIVIDNNAYNPTQINLICEEIKNKCNHYIFTSSAAVYLKHSSKHGLKENEATGFQEGFFSLKVKSYALEKLAAERTLQENYKGLNYTVLRFPNIFGEGDFLFKLTFFQNKLKNNEKLFLEKEINKFSLIYVKDVIKIFDKVSENKDCLGKIINFADPKAYTYDEFFSKIYGSLYSPNKKELIPAKKMWNSEEFFSLPFTPLIDTSLSKSILGNTDYAAIETWGPNSLKWETEHFKNN